jgi:molybdopterin synthase catalytic subunit
LQEDKNQRKANQFEKYERRKIAIMSEHKRKKVLVIGAITPQFIADSIAKHSTQTSIGAHDIFLGQVRADAINGKTVQAIDYSAYEEMAEDKFHEIREAAFAKFDLTCMHTYHSIGKVKAGEICLFVFVSSHHRKMAFDACRWIVEEIKANVPIFGKEIFEDETYSWKENKN